MVNTYTSNDQLDPDVAIDQQGNFVVVWQSGIPNRPGSDQSASGIAARKFRADGVALGNEFIVNSHTQQEQVQASVSTFADGRFVVSWLGCCAEGVEGNFVRVYDGDAAPRSLPTLVSPTLSGGQAVVTTLEQDHFAIAWGSLVSDPPVADIVARVFRSDQSPVTEMVRADANEQGNNRFRSILPAPGGFTVLWESDQGFCARDFLLSGQQATPPVCLAPDFVATGPQPFTRIMSVARDPAGNYLAVWLAGYGYFINSSFLYLQRFSPQGDSLGPPVQIHSVETEPGSVVEQQQPFLRMGRSGGFVIVWSQVIAPQQTDPRPTSVRGEPAPASGTGIVARAFDASGNPIGSAFEVNQEGGGAKSSPTVAISDEGRLVFVWTESMNRRSRTDIFGRVFQEDRLAVPLDVPAVSSGWSLAALASIGVVILAVGQLRKQRMQGHS